MRYLLIVSCLIFTVSGFAKKRSAKTKFEISFTKQKQNHNYQLIHSKKHPGQYKLVFTNEKRKKRAQLLSQESSAMLLSEVSRLSWTKRKPAAARKCTTYAKIKLDGVLRTVCNQEKELVGKTYGFLHKLNKIFK